MTDDVTGKGDTSDKATPAKPAAPKRKSTLIGTTRRGLIQAAGVGAVGAIGAAAGVAGGRAGAQEYGSWPYVEGPLSQESAAAARRIASLAKVTTAPSFGPDDNGFRSEVDIFDCDVEGKIPEGMNGVFYRVGPDPQYPMKEGNIGFDGEGMVGAFRFKNGKVSFKCRYVKNQRWKAQAAAGERLFGMYRNPFDVDPRAQGISPGTANTHIVVHHGKLLALKEDSPPVAMDPLTLETTDDYYLFGGTYNAPAHTAHVKIDSVTGEMWGFGYEAKGLGTTDIYVYKAGLDGKVNWEAWIQQPYPAMIHDFAVTERHIGFFICPLAVNIPQMRAGGLHFAYDSSLPSFLGVMRRDGDGSDIMWLEGPERMSTHTMGSFSDGDVFYYDMDMGTSNQFPFFPNLDGAPFNPVTAGGYVSRMRVDFSDKTPRTYEIETMYPDIAAYLPRQDDRYTTMPYRYGFMPWTDRSKGPGNGAAWLRFDHSNRTTVPHYVGDASSASEMCFVPRSADAPEGDGYIVGVVNRMAERRTELLVIDTQNFDGEPVARVRLPMQISGQVHGWWTPADQIPGWDEA
jgi:carotenoid cleavage dioxygenase